VSVPEQTHARYEAILAEVEAPFAFVDLDAMRANAEEMLGRAGTKPIRVASKSVRCRALLERILALDRRFAGVMTFTLPETLWLAEQGFEVGGRVSDQQILETAVGQPQGLRQGEGHQPVEALVAIEDALGQGPAAQ
jgi:hypothetical protein